MGSKFKYDNNTGEIHRIVFPQALPVPEQQPQPALLLPLVESPAVRTARFPFAPASASAAVPP